MDGGAERDAARFISFPRSGTFVTSSTDSGQELKSWRAASATTRAHKNQIYSPNMLVLTVRERCVLFLRMSAALEREIFSKF